MTVVVVHQHTLQSPPYAFGPELKEVIKQEPYSLVQSSMLSSHNAFFVARLPSVILVLLISSHSHDVAACDFFVLASFYFHNAHGTAVTALHVTVLGSSLLLRSCHSGDARSIPPTFTSPCCRDDPPTYKTSDPYSPPSRRGVRNIVRNRPSTRHATMLTFLV